MNCGFWCMNGISGSHEYVIVSQTGYISMIFKLIKDNLIMNNRYTFSFTSALKTGF